MTVPAQTDAPTLAQIVAALEATYTPSAVLTWLTGRRYDGPPVAELIRDGDLEKVAAMVRRIGDADPSDFTIQEVQ